MEPEINTPTALPKARGGRKRRWIVVGTIMVVVVGATAVGLITTFSGKKQPSPEPQVATSPSAAFRVEAAGAVIHYASSPVYDACGLVSFNSLKQHIPNFKELLDTAGSKDQPLEPAMMQHEYFDRNVPQPLGNDGQPRPVGSTVSDGVGSINASSFISLADSNCAYGQAGNQSVIQDSTIKSTFAKLYITQKPTPLSGEFLSFIGSQKKFEDHNFETIDIYTESTKDKNGYFTAIFVKKDHSAAVIFKTGIEALFKAASDDIAARLSQPPAGPMAVTYPEPYKQLSNPCALLSADDFEHITSKPASALAQEAAWLTGVGNRSMRRECTRLEIDRDILKSNISKTKISLTQASSVGNAEQSVKDVKNNQGYRVQPLKASQALGDEAYIKINQFATTDSPPVLEVRRGATIISLTVSLEQADANLDAFEDRMVPVATKVLVNLEKQTK